jgi:hypothetical protein
MPEAIGHLGSLHVHTIVLDEEMDVDERGKQRFTDELIEVPESLCLATGQLQAGHLRELTLNPAKHLFPGRQRRRGALSSSFHAITLSAARDDAV